MKCHFSCCLHKLLLKKYKKYSNGFNPNSVIVKRLKIFIICFGIDCNPRPDFTVKRL